jgi:pimeloyl-ACP methyl ester carboxylesterase
VIGFSQGASLALSILYHHEINQPHKPPPFRFAVFICSVLSVSPDPEFNADIIAKYSRYYRLSDESGLEEKGENSNEEEEEEEEKTSKFKKGPRHRVMLLLPGQKRALANDMVGFLRQLSDKAADNGTAQKLWAQRGGDEGFPRFYHPLVNKQRISIPSVHIIGRSDPLRRQSELQARLCSKSLTRVVEFHGGHGVPRTLSDLQSVAFEIERAIRMAQLR